MFSDEEVKATRLAIAARGGAHNGLDDDDMRVVMAKTAELLASRSGTMTAEDLREALSKIDALRMPDDWPHDYTAYVADHISAQGARVAMLEKENERLKASADELQRQRDSSNDSLEHMRERLSATEESVRDLTRRAQQAEAGMDRAMQGLTYWRGRCATLSAAGQVLSEHVDKARAVCERLFYWLAMGDEGPESELPCPEEIAELPKPIAELLEEARVAARGLGGLKDEDENHARYPRSPTCTHDDAANPGHPEREKERSEAVKQAAAPDPVGQLALGAGAKPGREIASYRAGYEQGCDDMRAACWEAVQQVLQELGYGTKGTVSERIKSAIEGAAP